MATAAPKIPILNCVIKIISKITFKIDDTIKNIRGIMLFPMALRRPANKLYANITPTHSVSVDIYEYDSYIISSGVFKNFKSGNKIILILS